MYFQTSLNYNCDISGNSFLRSRSVLIALLLIKLIKQQFKGSVGIFLVILGVFLNFQGISESRFLQSEYSRRNSFNVRSYIQNSVWDLLDHLYFICEVPDTSGVIICLFLKISRQGPQVLFPIVSSSGALNSFSIDPNIFLKMSSIF